ncbi:Ubiquitin carboxyl-terminal hydrolase family protein [Prunus dulcis]|uniref:Ubiquitin carboxyl-terminal hydrolase family protein n=1 Tax=Prunus dulcis TaxID=3755 RepID=A0A4Y1RT36_PRUDU|nr:Ubiquitin carboxyl-terminal hydrolase family protein [Prunus dulcis]
MRRIIKASNGIGCLKVIQWPKEYAVSELQRSKEGEGQTVLAFPMNFPKGYGGQKKVRVWMEEFQKLPYISPYEDSRHIDPNSDLMEKRVVGVLHELLSLTLHKKTKRNYLRSLREELNLPHKFTRIFTREGYQRGKLVNRHPLTRVREKFYHVMRTGLLYRSKGVHLLSPQEILLNSVESESGPEESEEDEVGTGDECYEDEMSNLDSEGPSSSGLLR